MILEEFLQEFNMAKKRTRKDKIRASQKQKVRKTAVIDRATKSSAVSQKNKAKITKTKKVTYDSSFVIQDLKKTFVVTLIVLIVLGIIALLYT